MHIGIGKFLLRLPENQNLKGKRRVIKSLMDKLRQQFKVAVAEVEHNEQWQLSAIGIVCVSNSSKHISEILSHINQFVLEQTGEFELLEQTQKIINEL